MLKIKLQRTGKKKQAYFRLVVQEHTKKPRGKYTEALGHWDPHANTLVLKKDRAQYWLSHGAQATSTVYNLFVDEGVITGEKVQSWRPKIRKGQKAEQKEKQEESEEKPEKNQEAQAPASNEESIANESETVSEKKEATQKTETASGPVKEQKTTESNE